MKKNPTELWHEVKVECNLSHEELQMAKKLGRRYIRTKQDILEPNRSDILGINQRQNADESFTRILAASNEHVLLCLDILQGLNPKKLIANGKSISSEKWKAPVGEWIREIYSKRFQRQ